MSYKYVINIKGISASGKSSRLHVFVEYLRELGLTLEDFIKPDFKGKDQSYGTLIKEFNLVILGKNYVKDGVSRFQGFDAVTGRQDKAAKWSDFIIENMADGYSFIVEGAGITCSHRYRPKFLSENIPGLNFVANYYYNFEPTEKPEYLARVKYRSGKEPNKDSMWNNNEGIRSDFNKADVEFREISSEYPELRYDSLYGSFREPIHHFGELFFTKVFNSPDKVESFKKFCAEYDYVSKNKYSGPVLEKDITEELPQTEDPVLEKNSLTEDIYSPHSEDTEEIARVKRNFSIMRKKSSILSEAERKLFDVFKGKIIAAKEAQKSGRKVSVLEINPEAAETTQLSENDMGMEMVIGVTEENSLSVSTQITKEKVQLITPKEQPIAFENKEVVSDSCLENGHAKDAVESVVNNFSGISEVNDPKTEASIFPKLTINREIMKWEDHLFDFTPVERIGNMHFKREDRFAPLGYGGLNGSKLRQCIWLLTQFERKENSMLISGASVKSPQLPMGTAVARHFGMESVHILGATNPRSSIKRDMVEMATWMGANFQYESVGYNPFLQSKTRELHESRNKVDFYLNYGITPADDATDEYIHAFHAVGAFQTQNIPSNIETIIVPTGSSNSAISILYGLTKFREKFTSLKNVYLIGIGPDKTKLINHRLEIIKKLSGINTKNFHLDRTLAEAGILSSDPGDTAFKLNYRDIHKEGYTNYQSEIKFNYEGIEFHPTYEGKVMKYVSEKMPELLTEKTMMWIVGSRPKIEFMDNMKSEFGDIPTETNVFADNSATRVGKPKAKKITPEEKTEASPTSLAASVSKTPEGSMQAWFRGINDLFSKNGGVITLADKKINKDSVIFTIELPKDSLEESIPEDKETPSEKREIPLDPTIGLPLSKEDKELVIKHTDAYYDDPSYLALKLEEIAKKYLKVDQNKLPFKEKCSIPVGRAEAKKYEEGADARFPEYRREIFLDFYEFHLKYKAHPGAVYYVLPYMIDKFQMDIEQRLWFVFINGCTQNVVTTWMIYKEFPNLSEITYDKFEEWHRANWRKLHYDIDRRYQKGHMVEMWQDYVKNLDGKSQYQYFTSLVNTGDPEKDFWSVWNEVINNFKWYGRLSTYSYLEYLKIIGLNITCPSLFLYEKEGSKSPRNGLCKVMGRDDLDFHKDNEDFKGYGEDVLGWLEEESHALLAEAQERFKDTPFIKDVNFFTLESTLCCFKSWFRKNRRYPNVYNDMFYDRIVKMESEDWGDNDLQMFWDVRASNLPEHLRMESVPDDLGIHPHKQNWFRENGQVIMMEKEFPVYTNDYQESLKTEKMKRRNLRKE